MGEVATISGPSKLERFVADVLAGGRREQLMAALPAHIKPERFEREFSNALMQQPELLAYDARLVFREIARVANLGLRMEKDLGEAYLIEAYNYKTKRKEPQVRIGYRGMIKLAKQSGTYTKVYAREVHQSDQYDVLQGTEERLVHRPVLHGERGDVIEYYAVAQLTDGTAEFERMTLDETLAIRDRSDAWKAYQDGKIKSTPWATDEGEMAKKGLALDTPIPTPHGWTTMGELEVGHKVFDKDGDIVDVIAVSEVKSIPCFRVTFSCGDQIVCDDEHRWLARAGGSHASRHQFSVQTINELHEAKCAGLSVTVPVQAALDLPDANLPIDPYLLGYWLGDGTYDRANITCNSSILLFVIRAAKNAGYAATSLKDRRANVHTVKITEGFHQALRQNELLRNKHIPAIYLRASVAQRRQILCGLMDSDGCIEKERGRAKFCSTSETLADDVYELAVSLGETPCRHSNEARGFGVTTVARWVEWQPTFPCVTLPHKVANLKQRKITPYRAIRNIERIDSVPTKCIAVTSPSETYLAGRSMAPTHNTVIRRLCKRLDQSPELTEALKIEDEAEFPSMRDITPPSERRAPPAPKPQLVAPSPKVGKRAPSPKKPAPEKRSGAPYGGKKPEAETEPEGQDAPPYDDEESQQQLTALRGELDQPLNRDELTEIVERWTSCVRRMQPKHQNLAVAALSVRVADVFEDEPGPSFFSDEAEEGETD